MNTPDHRAFLTTAIHLIGEALNATPSPTTAPANCRPLVPDEMRILAGLEAGPLQLKELVALTGIGRSRLALICSLLVEAGTIQSGRDGYTLPNGERP